MSKYWDFNKLYDTNNKVKFDKIKNFDQFCKEIKTPEEALSYFILEKVRWTSDEEIVSMDRRFYWPDELIKSKTGVCFDQSIFFYYFLKRKHIKVRYLGMSWNDEDNKYRGSHVVPAFTRDNRYYSIIYLPNYVGWIHGPFNSWDECAKYTGETLENCLAYADVKVYAITEYWSEEFEKEIDNIYGRKDVKVYHFLSEDGFRRIRWSNMVELHYGRFSFWNPVVSLWNITRFLRDTFGLKLPYYGLKEEQSELISSSDQAILEEKLKAKERTDFGLPAKKKYPMPDANHVLQAIRMFNHCDPEDEEELARNIKKYMRRYNMKDVKVGKDNRFSKYYNPKSINESSKIAGDGTFEEVLFVYNRLSDEDKSFLGCGDKYIDDPACVYRKVALTKDTKTPLGFIELYDSSLVAENRKEDYDPNIKDVNIGIAVDKEFRGKGVATLLIKGAIHWFKKSKYETLTYIVHDGNESSHILAKKCGFAYMWRREDQNETIYMITNPTKLKAIRENTNEYIRMTSYIIRASVNERQRLLEMSGGGGPMIGLEINDQSVQYSSPGSFVINYTQKNTFVDDDGKESNYAIANDILSKYIYRKVKGKYVKEDAEVFLKNKDIRIYEYVGDKNKWFLLLNEILSGYGDPSTTIYEDLSGKRELSEDQIDFDEQFKFFNLGKAILEMGMFKATVDIKADEINNNKRYEFPVNESMIDIKGKVILEDQKGYFIYDPITGNRTISIDKDTLLRIYSE